ncbi:MAG: hypothetical protein KJZ86_07095 [Caldilineaceae bacterium]|nr:hypothetical protein [Caldilineaceae bacterium]
MDILVKTAAVLLLLVGAIYPLAAIFGLMKRMNRKPGPLPSPAQVMVRMLLIAAVPLAGILGGFAGLAPSVWESSVLRGVILIAGAASLVGFVALGVLSARDKAPAEGKSSLISK